MCALKPCIVLKSSCCSFDVAGVVEWSGRLLSFGSWSPAEASMTACSPITLLCKGFVKSYVKDLAIRCVGQRRCR